MKFPKMPDEVWIILTVAFVVIFVALVVIIVGIFFLRPDSKITERLKEFLKTKN